MLNTKCIKLFNKKRNLIAKCIISVLGIYGLTSNILYGQNPSDSIRLRNNIFVESINASHETSYITVLGGSGNIEPLIFEASIVPYYMLRFNKNTRWGVEISPKIIIRMYNEYSYPLRTPSYMPRATLYLNIGKLDSRIQKQFFFISWGHHSNGQNGSFADSVTHIINTKDGNFLTNFIEAGPFFSREPSNHKFVTDYLKVSITYHYMQDADMKKMYGNLRINHEIQSIITLPKSFSRFKINSGIDGGGKLSSLRLSIKSSIILGDMVGSNSWELLNRITTSWSVSFRPDYLKMLLYYYGQDYYNIWFARNLSVFRFGIQADTFKFLVKH